MFRSHVYVCRLLIKWWQPANEPVDADRVISHLTSAGTGCTGRCCANCITPPPPPPPQNNFFNTQAPLNRGLFCCLTGLYGNWTCPRTGWCWGCDITLRIFTPVSAPRKQQQETTSEHTLARTYRRKQALCCTATTCADHVLELSTIVVVTF